MRKRLASSVRCAIINKSKITDKKEAAHLLRKDILNCANSSGLPTDTGTSCVPNEEFKIDEGTLEELLKDQQIPWQDATDDTPTDPLEPNQPLDNQMICDIQSIVSRLMNKAEQLLGKLVST